MWNKNDSGWQGPPDILGAPEAAYFELQLWARGAGLGLFTAARVFKRGLEIQSMQQD